MMTFIKRSTTEMAFIDIHTPTRILCVRVLGIIIYRRELRNAGRLAVSYLFGVPIYQTDGRGADWQY